MMFRAALPTLRSGVRNYAAAAGGAKNHISPPKAVPGVSGTYATALWTAAARDKQLDKVENALSSLNSTIQKDQQLQSILANPSLSKDDKTTIANQLGSSNQYLKQFVSVLAENNRLNLLSDVAKSFQDLMRAHRGEVEVTITSAQPLDNKTINRLQSAIAKSKYGSSATKLQVSNRVNDGIVGGLIVEIGDRTIDLSVSGRMARINRTLTESL